MRRTLTRSRVLFLVILAAVVLSPALVATSAQAAPYRVGIKLSDTNVVIGEDVRVSGQVRPLTTGRVTLQRRTQGKWRTLKRVKLVASSYATTVSFDDAGVAFLRVVAPASKGNKLGTSRTRTVRVLHNATNPKIATASLPGGSVGTPYEAQVKTTDGRAGTWSIGSGALPPGLSIAPGTGVISGTPTAKIASEFAAYFKDRDGRVAAKLFTITIGDETPDQLIVTSALPNGVKGSAYAAQLKSKDDRAGTWSITTGSLPAGLTLNASTGAITGTPTAIGKSDFTVRFVDANENSSTRALSITVGDAATAPVIATSALPNGVVGVPYATQMHTADGRTGTWSITAGTLPPGLTLTAATGVISGTPSAAAISDFTVRFQDAAGASTTKAFSILIEATGPEIVTTTLPAAVKGEAYSVALKTKDSRAGLWNVAQGTLPAGLALNASTGVLSGTPTTVGSSTFTVRFRDTLGISDTQELTLVVANSRAVITTATLPEGRVGEAYTAQLATADSRAGTWSVSVGTLPAGLSLNGTTGAITGTPTARGTSNFTVTFKDTAGVEATKALSIRVKSCFLIFCS